MKRVLLHVGLHKTGTTFFQVNVFPFLDGGQVVYNPYPLTTVLLDALVLQDRDLLDNEKEKRLINFVQQEIEKIEAPKILISNELLSQNMYKLNYRDRIKILSKCFPGAEIILFLRHQVDWIRSAYLQALQEGFICEFEEFIGSKKLPEHMQKNDCFQEIEWEKVDFLSIIDGFMKYFGDKKVHIIFYEDFRDNAEKTLKRFSALSETRLSLRESKMVDRRVNRSYSKRAVIAAKILYKMANQIGARFVLEAGRRQMDWWVKEALEKTFKPEGYLGRHLSPARMPVNLMKSNQNIINRIMVIKKKIAVKFRIWNPARLSLQLMDSFSTSREPWLIPATIKSQMEKFYYFQNQQLSESFPSIGLPPKYLAAPGEKETSKI